MSLSIEALRRRLSACMNLDARRLSSRLHGVKKLPEAKQAAKQALDKGVKKPEDARKIINLK